MLVRAAVDLLGVEEVSYGGFVAFDVDESEDVVEGERTRCQPKDDRDVGTDDGVEIAAIVAAHLCARACRSRLEQLVVGRDPHRR